MSLVSQFRNRLTTRALSELLDRVGRARKTGDAAAIREALRASAQELGGETIAKEMGRVVTGRISGELDHREASESLHALAHSLPASITGPALWAMAQLAQSVGCFQASQGFSDRALEHMARSSESRERLVSAVVRRDLDAAIEASARGIDADAKHYLWWWSGGVAGSAQWSTEQPWVDSLRGSQVLMVGPAPTSLHPDDIPDNALIGRVIAPGVVSWPAADVASGRCDLVWANSSSTKWFVQEAAQAVFENFRFSSFRTDKWKALHLPNGRTALNHKGLLPMSWDKTNMVPLAVWDLLHIQDVDVAVTGTTFFASRTAYSPHEVRVKTERGGATDQRGSTGLPFERCQSFSHHALLAHLSLMANLSDAGAIGFDEEGKAVLAMEPAHYLAELDELYGVPGI